VNGEWTVTKAIMSRSARVLMEGWVRVPATRSETNTNPCGRGLASHKDLYSKAGIQDLPPVTVSPRTDPTHFGEQP
jgi:hypothetical protein